MDYDYWLRLAYSCRGGFIDQVLVRRRMHRTNIVTDYEFHYEKLLTVLERLPRTFPQLSETARRAVEEATATTRYRLGSWYLQRNEIERARLLTHDVAQEGAAGRGQHQLGARGLAHDRPAVPPCWRPSSWMMVASVPTMTSRAAMDVKPSCLAMETR